MQPQGNEGNEPAFEFGLRPGQPDDLDFIADSWRRSYDDAPNTRCPGGLPEYIATQRQVIEQCLRTSSLLVGYPRAPEHEPKQILGWVCFRKSQAGTVVHYVYVKPPCRRKEERMGTTLLRAVIDPVGGAVYHTHRFDPWEPAMSALLAAARTAGIKAYYNPALIFAPAGGTL